MEKISVLVTAWNNVKYLEECLDSINRQGLGNDKFEVLLGIDGCVKTKRKFLEIRNKYKDLDLKAYLMLSNKGTYITTNTLAKLANNNILLRFDSDDIMREDMLFKIFKTYNGKDNLDLVIFRCTNFNKGKESLSPPLEGVMSYTKSSFEKVGGYKPWRCAADTDFFMRLKFSKINSALINESLYKRRIHNESLTRSPETKFGSKTRMEYARKLARKFEKIKTITNRYEKL